MITAVYLKKPNIPIPSEWVKTKRQYIKYNDYSDNELL